MASNSPQKSAACCCKTTMTDNDDNDSTTTTCCCATAMTTSNSNNNSNSNSSDIVLRFDVKDSGPGIPQLQQSKLFSPFFQVDSSATRKHGGTGLGMFFDLTLDFLVAPQTGHRAIASFFDQMSCLARGARRGR